MTQISQKELERRYVTITCLQKRQPKPKNEKNLAKWVKAGKLQWAKNYPYEQIIQPSLKSQEFWTSNSSVPVESGTYRKIGEFKVTVQAPEFALISPTWEKVLQSCPEQYTLEGVGLYLLRKSNFDSHNFQKEWTVWVMKRSVPGSKGFLSSLSDEQLGIFMYIHNISTKSLHLAIREVIYNTVNTHFSDEDVINIESKKFHVRIVRRSSQTFRTSGILRISQPYHRPEKIRTLRKEGKDVKELLKLADIMKRHPERFWGLQNID